MTKLCVYRPFVRVARRDPDRDLAEVVARRVIVILREEGVIPGASGACRCGGGPYRLPECRAHGPGGA